MDRVTDLNVFDTFVTADACRAITPRVTLQPDKASFTDVELKDLADRIVVAAAKAGEALRG